MLERIRFIATVVRANRARRRLATLGVTDEDLSRLDELDGVGRNVGPKYAPIDPRTPAGPDVLRLLIADHEGTLNAEAAEELRLRFELGEANAVVVDGRVYTTGDLRRMSAAELRALRDRPRTHRTRGRADA